MATTSFDTLLHVYQDNQALLVGQESIWTEKQHPGSGRMIEGWKWDERVWPPVEEFEALAFAPSIWDPSTENIPDSAWQSGYGDNKDLLLLAISNVYEASGLNIWTPKLNHGYFYVRDTEWYLYSDYYQAETFRLSNTVSGQQYLDLTLDYKPTIPIQVRSFYYNKLNGQVEVDIDARKRVEFSTSATDPEFVVDTSYSPPRIWMNGIYNEEIGGEVTEVSGVVSATISGLEVLGRSNGNPNQELTISFSPIDPSQPIEVWSWNNLHDFQEWTILSGLETFTPGEYPEVNIDLDKGILKFGDYHAVDNPGGAGMIPEVGHKISVRYTKAVAALYEPLHTRDYILAREANVNPVIRASNRGFVQVATKTADPAYILLEADLVQLGSLYSINLGNNTGRLIATVKDATGATIEGAEVTFEILYPEVGTFGASQRMISAITDSAGQAKTTYNSPATIQDVGQASDELTELGGDTILTVEGITNPGTVSGLYLYKIHEYDLALGIPDTDVDQYYVDYLDEEGIVDGTTATPVWEADWRALHELGRPLAYDPTDPDDLVVGKKTIVVTSRANAINPHTGVYDPTALVPLYPSVIEDVGTEEVPALRLTYPLALDSIGTNDTKAYFLVGDAKTNVRAWVFNTRTNQRVYSNTIGIKIVIPNTVNGTYWVEELNHSGLLTRTRRIDIDNADALDADVLETSGIDTFWRAYQDEKLLLDIGPPRVYEDYIDWFRRTRIGDTMGLIEASSTVAGFDPGLINIDLLDKPGEIPLGFRLKSTGITVASMLDQITYLDPNDHLPSGYWDV